MTKALFLRGRPGSSTVMIPSWLWDKDVFVYEDAPAGDVRQKDADLLEHAKQYKPDVIFYMSVCPRDGQIIGHENLEGIPRTSTLRHLREIAPTVHVCSDGGDPGWINGLAHYVDTFSAHVNIDGVKDWPLAGKKNAMVALTPCPPVEVQVLPLSYRQVDFGYFGSMGVGTKRHALCEELKRTAGLKVWVRKCLSSAAADSYEDYCAHLRCFRISFNTAWSGDEQHTHVKGRVVESGWMGCCLLETAGSKTRDWFTPEVDYWEYEDAAEAAKMVKELLATDISQHLADNLRRKAMENHNPRKFWQQACELVGVSIKESNDDSSRHGAGYANLLH